MHRLNRGITGSWWLVALNTYLTLSIAGTTLLMIDPGDTYVSTFIGPLMSALLPAHVMYVAIAFALPQMIYLVLAGYGLLNLISTRRILAYTNISCKHKRTPARVLFSVLGTVLGKQKETPGG